MPNAFELKKKRDNGICLECTNVAVSGKKKCQKCLDRAKARTVEQKMKGLCRCGDRPLVENKSCCSICLESRRKYAANKRQARRDGKLCHKCGKTSQKPLCHACSQEQNNRNRTNRDTIKYKVMLHYSKSDKPICECCNESCLIMLTIDHINGNGNQHRIKETNGRGADTFYRWLRNNNYPAEYRVLCFNCNISAYHNNGICSHTQQQQLFKSPNS